MSLKNNDEIIQNKLHQVEESLSHPDFLGRYILTTLDGFAYRYFDNPSPAEMISPTQMKVIAIEAGIKEAIKLKNPELRAGITELVKKVSKAEGPTILRELRVNLIEHDPRKGGRAVVTGRISFGHPDHQMLPGTFVEKKSICEFADDMSLRNTLARHLEEAAEIFS